MNKIFPFIIAIIFNDTNYIFQVALFLAGYNGLLIHLLLVMLVEEASIQRS